MLIGVARICGSDGEAHRCGDSVSFFQGRRIPDTESLGLSYGSFMSRRIGLVMPSFVVAIKSTKV
jgi:hypothetical protein